MVLQVAIEEELCMLLGRDYYERNRQASSRNGSKRRAVNIGCGEAEIAMPQVRGLERPNLPSAINPGECFSLMVDCG
jgi:transposase-like protein